MADSNERRDCAIRTFDWKWCQEFIEDSCFDVAFEDTAPRWQMEAVIKSMDNVVLKWKDHGIFVLVYVDDGIYQVHTLFKDTSEFAEAADVGFGYMFCALDADALVTPIPEFNKVARVAAKRVGFKKLEDSTEDTFVREGTAYPITNYIILAYDWALKSKSNIELGKEFHRKLHEKLGYENHPEDVENDAMAGFVWKAIDYGNLGRIGIYNAWAAQANFVELVLYNVAPPVIDIGDGVIVVRGNDFEVI